jgi:hypothetical protein
VSTLAKKKKKKKKNPGKGAEDDWTGIAKVRVCVFVLSDCLCIYNVLGWKGRTSECDWR